MSTPPIHYARPQTAESRPRRSWGTWATLLIVWAVGIVVWAFYIFVLAYLFFGAVM